METNSYNDFDYNDFEDDFENDFDYNDLPDDVAEQDEWQRKFWEWEEQEFRDNQLEYLSQENNRLWGVIEEIKSYLENNQDIGREDIEKILEKVGNSDGEEDE